MRIHFEFKIVQKWSGCLLMLKLQDNIQAEGFPKMSIFTSHFFGNTRSVNKRRFSGQTNIANFSKLENDFF